MAAAVPLTEAPGAAVRRLARTAVLGGLLGAAAAGLAAGAPARAVTGPGTVTYVANALGPSVTEYAADAGPDAAPLRSITGSGVSTPQGVAVDAAGALYVVNAGPGGATTTSGPTGSVTVYQPGADGSATPVRTIAGTSTALIQPQAIAVDRLGDVYVVAGTGGNGSVDEYAAGAAGNVAPVHRLTGLSNPGGVALGPAGDVYVASQTFSGEVATGSVSVYAPGAGLGRPPVRVISGPATGLTAPQALSVDRSGVVDVLDTADGQNRVLEFAPQASGGAAPLRVLALPARTIPQGLAVDSAGFLHVSSQAVRYVPAAPTGDRAAGPPRLTASTPATGAPAPSPTPSPSPSVDNIAEYAPGASGSAAPVRTIAGGATGLRGPRGLAVADLPPAPSLPPAATPGAAPHPPVTAPPAPTPTAGAILPLVPASPSPGPSSPPVTPGPPPTGAPGLAVSPARGSPGQVVTVHGAGYPPATDVTVLFAAGTSQAMTSPGIPTAATGEFTASFRVPGLAPGAYVVLGRSACCVDARATFTLVVAAAATASGRSALTQLSQAVPDLGQVAAAVRRDLGTLARGLALAAFMLLLVGFPAELFNKTLEENHEEVRGWFRWLRGPWRLLSRLHPVRPPRRLLPEASRPVVRFAAFCVVAAAFSAMVDPDVLHHCHEGLECTSDWWTKTAAVFLGFLVAVPVTTLLYAVPEEAVHRSASRQAGELRVLPLALLAAALFAGWSVIARFLPGYVYGLVAGYATLEERSLTARHRGLAVLLGGSAVLAMSLLIWLAWGPVHEAAAERGAGLVTLTLDTTLAQLVVLGTQAVVFGLLPFRFLAGERLKDWSRIAWIALYGTAAAFYAVVLTVSTRETMGAARAAGDELDVIGLFAGFGAFSFLFWGYFRLRGRHREGAGVPGRD